MLTETRFIRNEQETKECFDSMVSFHKAMFDWLKKDIDNHGILGPSLTVTAPHSTGVVESMEVMSEIMPLIMNNKRERAPNPRIDG